MQNKQGSALVFLQGLPPSLPSAEAVNRLQNKKGRAHQARQPFPFPLRKKIKAKLLDSTILDYEEINTP